METTTAPTLPATVAPSSEHTDAGADESTRYPIEYLHGMSSAEPTGVTIVSGTSVIDVDTDAMRPIAGLPAFDDQNVWATPSADRAVIGVQRSGSTNPEIFVLDRDSRSARPLGSGFPAPAPDGVWLKRFESPTSCVASKVAFDGPIIRSATPIDCAAAVTGEYGIGLIMAVSDIEPRYALVSPVDLSTVTKLDGFKSVIGSRILTLAGHGFGLIDPLTGEGRQVEMPTSIGMPSGLSWPADGAHVAIAFGHPAWPGPRQRLDVWVLDVDSLEWTELPSMPVAAALKMTAYQWLADGRFAIFGEFDRVGPALATWRPGDAQLVVHPLTGTTSQGAVMWCTLGELCAKSR